jgi:hypothetical protein
MANSRDFTGKNRKFTGTKGIVTPKGTTGQRVGAESGELRFNTTTELMEYYDGTTWKPIDAPPTISSITTSDAQGTNNILNADGSTLHTITINGGNFGIGAIVKFIGNTGTEYSALSVNRVSGSQITCTTRSNMGTTDDPYDIQVTNASGLAATLEDAFSYNAPPVFTVASGQLGTVYNTQVISGTTLNAGATDAEGNTITFTIISGSLPGSGLTISSSTGAITGTLAGTPSLGNYPFVVRASTTEGVVERQFSIQVVANPFISATGGTETTTGNYKIHTFTGPGSFVVSSAGSATGGSNIVDYLVVAGGGSGGQNNGAGGGAGGFREAKSPLNASPHTASPLATTTGITLSAQTYPITVGGGGTFGPASGSNSVFATITSSGGGGGARDSANGTAGGSGGGGSHDGGIQATGGSGNSPPVAPPQGNPGGNVVGTSNGWGGGGGGGATAAGGEGSSPNSTGGPGGAGATTSISNSPTVYSGGGGGSSDGVPVGGGGIGGGGAGGQSGGNGNPGTTNLGGGGGGADGGTPGNGGSGIVIIRYKFQ